jgi:hypothetical protein
MARVKVTVNLKSLKNTEKYIKDSIDRALKETDVLAEIGELVRKDVVFQSRKGKFDPNTPEWIKTRKAIAAADSTHPTYAPNRSNITLSGQLLDSFTAFVNKAKRLITLEFIGQHFPYRAARKTSWRVKAHTRKGKLSTTQVRGHERTGPGGTYQVGEITDNSEIADHLLALKGNFLKVRDQVSNRARILLSNAIRRIHKSDGTDAS